LVRVLADADPWRVSIHDERGDAAVPLLGIRRGEDDVEARQGRVRDPRLFTVQDELVAVRREPRTEAGDVAAAARLGRAVAREARLRGEHPEVLFLLLLVASELDGRERERVGEQARLNAGAGPGELFGDERVLELAEAGTPVLRGDRHVDEADLVSGLEHVARKARFPIALGGDRQDPLAREAPRGFDQSLLLVRQ